MPDQVAGWAPLAGLRILELSTYVAGPSGAMALAQLGADVIRVDPPGGATDTRRLPLAPSGRSIYWAGLNQTKRSIEVDTRSPAGRQLIIDLLKAPGAGTGILLTNAVGQRWLDHETLTSHRSDIIQVRIQGHSDGAPAVDYTINSEVGLPLLTGPQESNRPVNHVLPAWDLLAGLHAATAILAADRHRNLTGEGQFVTVSLADVAAASMAHLGFIGDRVVNGSTRLREGNYLYGSFGCDFATTDGNRVMLVALTPRHWTHLVEATGIGPVVAALEATMQVDLTQEDERYQHRLVLSALLEPWFAERTLPEVSDVLESSGVLWGVYRTLDEFVCGEQSLLARSPIFEDVDQHDIGRYPVPGSVLRTPQPGIAPRPAPLLGDDTDDVLVELLELTADDLEALHDAGVLGRRRTTGRQPVR
jgi:2-methylfumaryl-CoA isomerase